MVGQQHRLGTLQMGVAGEDGVQVLLGPLQQNALQVPKACQGMGDGLFGVEAHVCGHLVVTGAGGVQTPRHRPDEVVEAGLNVHVDVFQVLPPGEDAFFNLPADGTQAHHDKFGVFFGDDALASQHPRVGNGTGDVLTVEASVKAQGSHIGDVGLGLAGFKDAHPYTRYLWSSWRAMTRRWISLVPSPMTINGASR
ncbi:hypothetical protein HRbin23_00743 [bacterium HR23]|nr:hypothetical protein HRbin23_00743 [bacterium HR23]